MQCVYTHDIHLPGLWARPSRDCSCVACFHSGSSSALVFLPPASCLLKTSHRPSACDPELVQKGRKRDTPPSAHSDSSALQGKGSPGGEPGEPSMRLMANGTFLTPCPTGHWLTCWPSRSPDLTGMPAWLLVFSRWPETVQQKGCILLCPWGQAGGGGQGWGLAWTRYGELNCFLKAQIKL